ARPCIRSNNRAMQNYVLAMHRLRVQEHRKLQLPGPRPIPPFMARVLESVDRLTRLVGQNRLELLLFRLSNRQLYGINVFKVREVVPSPPLRRFPMAHPLVAGLARVRGVTVPVLDVARAIGLPPLTEEQSRYIVLTEFSRSLQGLLVSDIERIVNAG